MLSPRRLRLGLALGAVMFLVTINKARRLLYLSYVGRVTAEQLQQGREDFLSHLAELGSGFRVVVDLGRLDRMDPDCATEIGKGMELCEQRGVGLVIRIVPDPSKDIGWNILAIFHYQKSQNIITCRSLAEAEEAFQLGPMDHSNDST